MLTGPERLRRWNEEEQRQIFEEAFSPGACVTQVAQRHDVSWRWRSGNRDRNAVLNQAQILNPVLFRTT
ncbi:transposase [Mesorhizobium sp. M0915]|uniref:transposase n=1 Tax=Mesorhizobium sp. M0915 TaxID=2957027 RepID=UPI003338C3A4